MRTFSNNILLFLKKEEMMRIKEANYINLGRLVLITIRQSFSNT